MLAIIGNIGGIVVILAIVVSVILYWYAKGMSR